MPHPRGRDRVEEPGDGTVVLLSLHPKPWSVREDAVGTSPARAGSAVQWDDALYEVLRIEPRPAGGVRHVLAPWDERFLVRTVVVYGDEDPAATPAAADEPSLPSAAAPAAARAPGKSAWARLPFPVRALLPGFVAAVLLGWFFPVRVMGEGFSALVHELGHTAAAWLFGCTALPAIVVTIAFEQVVAAAVCVWGVLGWLAWRFRRAAPWNALLFAAVAVYPFVAFTRAHLTFFDLGGHLAELLVACFALRRALRDGGPEWERPVWAFFGFYLVWRNAKLFGGVAGDASARTDYLTIAIAGQNDLVKVANTTGVALPLLAALVALAFVVVPAAVAGVTIVRGLRPRNTQRSSK